MFYGHCWDCGQRWELGTASTCVCPELQLEPVDYEKLAALGWQAVECRICGFHAQAFPKPQPKPLSDKELFKIWLSTPAETEDRYAFARAVEAAHGIKE